jgi:hypothetical protein
MVDMKNVIQINPVGHDLNLVSGQFWRRFNDWFDWMTPEAWNVEHNTKHVSVQLQVTLTLLYSLSLVYLLYFEREINIYPVAHFLFSLLQTIINIGIITTYLKSMILI